MDTESRYMATIASGLKKSVAAGVGSSSLDTSYLGIEMIVPHQDHMHMVHVRNLCLPGISWSECHSQKMDRTPIDI
jgi:hypothetical protein